MGPKSTDPVRQHERVQTPAGDTICRSHCAACAYSKLEAELRSEKKSTDEARKSRNDLAAQLRQKQKELDLANTLLKVLLKERLEEMGGLDDD